MSGRLRRLHKHVSLTHFQAQQLSGARKSEGPNVQRSGLGKNFKVWFDDRQPPL